MEWKPNGDALADTVLRIQDSSNAVPNAVLHTRINVKTGHSTVENKANPTQ